MSDEEDDYNSSDESSGNEYIDKKSGQIDGKPRVLTLEDNDDDEAAFHRPDLIDVYEEGEEEGESDGDIIEEDDTLDLTDGDGKSKSKKTSLTKKNSTRLYNGKPVLARNSNAASRADSEDQKNKKKKKVKK
jgi:hypothetical protein